MKKTIFILIAVVGMWACNKDDSSSTLSTLNATDQDFMIQASYSNHAEISAGQLAIAKTTNDSVRALAQKMVTDYTNGQEVLDSIALYVHVQVPQTADTIHQVLIQGLSMLSGITFDTTYLRAQITDHQNIMVLFQNEINTGSNIALKNYANVYLPVVQADYASAVALEGTK